jgi:hypothetical protein
VIDINFFNFKINIEFRVLSLPLAARLYGNKIVLKQY